MSRVSSSRGAQGSDPDAFLRRGLDRLGAQAGAPDTADLRTAVMARAKRDRAVQRLATSAALFLPVALAVWTAAALGNRDITGSFAGFGGSPNDHVAATASVTGTPSLKGSVTHASGLPSATSIPQRPTASRGASAAATSPVAPIPPVASAGTPPNVELAITQQVAATGGYVLTYHVSWSGADAPAVRVDLRQGTTVLRSTHRKVNCSVPGQGGSVDNTVTVIGDGPVVFQAVVYTQACGGSQSAGARTLTWNAEVPPAPTTTPTPTPTATSPAPTPSATDSPSVSSSATATEQPTVLPSGTPGGLMSPPLPEQASPIPTATASPTTPAPGVTPAATTSLAKAR